MLHSCRGNAKTAESAETRRAVTVRAVATVATLGWFSEFQLCALLIFLSGLARATVAKRAARHEHKPSERHGLVFGAC
jgi:hypothetical protein